MKIKRKAIILAIAAICLFPAALPAQWGPPMRPGSPEMESLMIYHMTEYLDLTPEQAEKFFPLYRDYQKKTIEIHKNIRTLAVKSRKISQNRNFTEKDFENLMTSVVLAEKKLQDQKIEYFNKIEQVLTPAQRAKLLFFEEEFRRQLRSRLKPEEPQRGRKK